MYIYRFSNFDYEDSIDVKLIHYKQFTKNDFSTIVNECIKKVTLKLEDNLILIDKLIKDAVTNPCSDKHEYLFELSHVSQINSNVLSMLINDYEFKEIEPTHTFVFNKGSYWTEPTVINDVMELD